MVLNFFGSSTAFIKSRLSEKMNRTYNATMNDFETVGKNILIENSQSSKITPRIFLQIALKL